MFRLNPTLEDNRLSFINKHLHVLNVGLEPRREGILVLCYGGGKLALSHINTYHGINWCGGVNIYNKV